MWEGSGCKGGRDVGRGGVRGEGGGKERGCEGGGRCEKGVGV